MLSDLRLFVLDGRSVVHEFLLVFEAWRDRLLLAGAIVVGLMALNARLAALPPTSTALAVLAVCAAIGFGVERTLARRLRFHATEGVLAAAALTAPARWSYRGEWHGVVLLTIAAALALAWPPAIPAGLRAMRPGAWCRQWCVRCSPVCPARRARCG